MSYILDALNKADKDRKQLQAPKAIPTQAHEAPQNKPMLWLVLVFIVCILSVWVFLKPESKEVTQAATPVVAPMLKPQQPQASIVAPTAVVKSTPQAPKQTLKPKPEAHSKAMPNIMGLNTDMRHRLTNIAISAHIFGDDASKRMVIINNRALHEGDYIADQLQLTAITQQGITLSFQGEPFTMRIKDKWPPY